MKRFTVVLAMAIVAVTLLYALPSNAQVSDKPVINGTWGHLKQIYRGNQPVPYSAERDSTATSERSQMARPGAGTLAIVGGVYLTWPFGTSKSEWIGWTGDKTSGGNIPNYCGDPRYTINSHTLGDYYARDLRRYDGNQAHQPIYASTGGYVLVAGINGCYGYSVIIWDPTRNIEIRYSHLSSVNPYVGPNMSIRQGALIGYVGGTGCNGIESFSPHLHMVVYKNLTYPTVGQICSGTYYACPFYFY